MLKTKSYVKAVKILHYYFAGMPQLTIAQKCLVNQSTVSRCAEKFEEEDSAKGIMAAAEEYQVMNEVSALRSLATDLYKSKTSIEEAKSGVKMVILFNSLGVPPEEFKVLAKMFKKLKDPDFAKVGMKIIKLEEAIGKEYPEIVSEFEQLGEEITASQEKIANLQEKQDKEEKALEALELDRNEKEEEIAEFLEEAGKKKAAADAEVKEKLDQAGLTLEKIDKVHPVVEKMNALGITDDKFEQFVKERQLLEEMGVTWEKFQTVAGSLAKAGEGFNGDSIATKLEEFGDLDKVITSMRAEETSLQPEVEKLGKEKIKLTAEVDGLAKSKAQLENEVGHLEGSKKALGATIESMNDRKIHLQKHMAVLENDFSKLRENKKGLMEEVEQKRQEIAAMNEKLKQSDAINQMLKGREAALQKLDAKIADAGQNFKLYEAFLGLVRERKETQIEGFLKLVPVLFDALKSGEYDPGFLVDIILGQLSGNILDKLGCENCGAEFVMLKRSQKLIQGSGLTGKIPLRCPDCGESLKTVVKTPLGSTLKKVIVTGKPTLEKPGTPSPEGRPPDHPETGKQA